MSSIVQKLSIIMILTLFLASFIALAPAATAAAAGPSVGGGRAISGPPGDKCGAGDGVKTSIDIGCKGLGNPILDLLFAIIRFLSAGVGVVIVASLVLGGIQYTISRGDPQSTAAAVNRLRSTVIALFIFIFAFAILNYLIPGRILR